ncbi:phage major tail tube protein [Pseudomonas viridiflava]|uniref:phage major tail tube protein n=1 Tax=Pseudomonas viridiflava TaxID=33069 RepID=UPI000F04298C|nr:phage major tail tube protein [Pseudomonas viridiflava]
MIPQTLFGMNAFIDGVSFKGEIPEFSLPKFTVKTEKFRGGGMDGEIEMDQGIELGEASFSTNGVRREALKFVGLVDGTAFNASFRGSFMGQKGVSVGVIATIRGRLKEVDPGSWKGGEKAEFKFVCATSYYKLEIDNSVMYELDPLNSIRVIDGVDQLTEVRNQLGI